MTFPATPWRIYLLALVLSPLLCLASIFAVGWHDNTAGMSVWYACWWNLAMLALLVAVLTTMIRRPAAPPLKLRGYVRVANLLLCKGAWVAVGVIALVKSAPMTREQALGLCLGIAIPLMSLLVAGVLSALAHKK